MSNEKFYNIPELELFLTTELPESLQAVDDKEFRTDLYKLALDYYKTGWEDAAQHAANHSVELVYAIFPDEK